MVSAAGATASVMTAIAPDAVKEKEQLPITMEPVQLWLPSGSSSAGKRPTAQSDHYNAVVDRDLPTSDGSGCCLFSLFSFVFR